MENEKYVVLSLSGGMDSSTLLLHLLNLGYKVIALSFDYGQKHKIEIQKAGELIDYINYSSARKDYSDVVHKVIKIEGIQELLHSTLVEGGPEVPEGHYEQANMIDTVVPNRNKTFSSLLQMTALSLANKNNTRCIIAMGIHAGDHEIYPDCRQEFRDADFKAFQIGNWNSERVSVYTPYLSIGKFEILQDGLKCCEELGLDFDEVYKRTNTSYKPVKVLVNVDDAEDTSFSDYKSAASVERILAFDKLGRPDPVQYADETGLVSWEIALNHALKVEKEFRESTV